MTIGEKIKEFRKKAGFTQKQLAIKCGVAEITIRQYESGKRQPRIEQLQIIAKALNMYLFEFMDDDYFDAATDEEPGSEERELDFLEQKTKVIKEILQNKNISEQEKQKMLNNHITQTAILSSYHAEEAQLGRKFLLDMLFEQLNDDGQEKAIEHIEMLTKIPDYQKGVIDLMAGTKAVMDKVPIEENVTIEMITDDDKKEEASAEED